MSNQSRSSRFLDLFESALLGYEKTTNIKLAKHPLAKQLQDCHSVESITTFLQDQARELGHFRESDKVMNSIKHTVSILCILSDTLTLRNPVHLVCPRPPMWCSDADSHFTDIPTYSSNTYWPRSPTCRMCHSPVPMRTSFSYPCPSGGQGG